MTSARVLVVSSSAGHGHVMAARALTSAFRQRYPAGGYYPQEGLYRRMGLLDIAPTQYGGLLAGYDQPQFEAMQAGFQRPVDVGLFQDPYDVAGYSLLT